MAVHGHFSDQRASPDHFHFPMKSSFDVRLTVAEMHIQILMQLYQLVKYQLVTFIVRRIRIMILQIRTTLVMRHLYITHR